MSVHEISIITLCDQLNMHRKGVSKFLQNLPESWDDSSGDRAEIKDGYRHYLGKTLPDAFCYVVKNDFWQHAERLSNKSDWDNSYSGTLRDDLGLIVFYEVEDTSKLKYDKLERYIDFWFFVDSTTSYEFILIVTDRYGENRRFIDLTNSFHSKMQLEKERGVANG